MCKDFDGFGVGRFDVRRGVEEGDGFVIMDLEEFVGVVVGGDGFDGVVDVEFLESEFYEGDVLVDEFVVS